MVIDKNLFLLCRLLAMIAMEHILLGFKIMMMFAIDDVPRWIREAIAQKNALTRETALKARLNEYASDVDTITNNNSGTSASAHKTSHKLGQVLHIASNAVGVVEHGLVHPHLSHHGHRSHHEHPAQHQQATQAPQTHSVNASERSSSVVATSPTANTNTTATASGSSVSFKPGVTPPSPATVATSATGATSSATLTSNQTAQSSRYNSIKSLWPSTFSPKPVVSNNNTVNSNNDTNNANNSPSNTSNKGISTKSIRKVGSSADMRGFDEGENNGIASAGAGISSRDATSSSHLAAPYEAYLTGDDSHAKAAALTTQQRLVQHTQSPFGFDPAQMMLLIALPAALHYFKITPWLYLPVAVLFFGYLQAQKDRVDRKMAMGIVCDPTLLRLILEEMPSWTTDAEFQRMV